MKVQNSFLIVIPSFNEEQNIGKVLRELLSANLPSDILVVNDGSIDGTEAEARKHGVKVVSHPCNLGYGAALQTGYKYANARGYAYLIQFDADGQHDPNDLSSIMEPLIKGEADIVMGSRFLASGDKYSTGIVKGFGICFFRLLIQRLTGHSVSDPTSGLRGVSRSVFSLYSGKEWFPADFPDANILIHQILMDFHVKEVPARMRKRKAGISMHAGLKPLLYMIQIMLGIIIVMIRHKRTKRWT